MTKLTRTSVCDVILQRCKMCTVPPAPLFSRSQQLSTDSLTLVSFTDCNLRNVTVENFPMHRIRRPFEPNIDESNDLPKLSSATRVMPSARSSAGCCGGKAGINRVPGQSMPCPV